MGVIQIQKQNISTKGDIRHTQILVMALVLLGGALLRDLSIRPLQLPLSILAALCTQMIFDRRLRRSSSYLSAIITAFGIALLLRSNTLWAHPAACCIAISSKFLIRRHEKHIFNPANLAVLIGLMFFPATWISSGQWGADVSVLFFFILLGNIALRRAKIQLMSWSFVFFYLGIWALHRVYFLGYEWRTFIHQLESGSFLLFAFFMISDPRTAPNHAFAKILHTATIALLAYYWQYGLYYHNGLLWALFFAAPLVSVWDKVFIAKSFHWDTNQLGVNADETGQDLQTADFLNPCSIPSNSWS